MTAYVPPSKEASDFRGTVRGKAKVLISPDQKRVKVVMDGGEQYIFAMEDCPDTVRPGTWIVVMNKAKDRLFRLSPVGGIHTAVFHDIVRQEGNPPIPQTFSGKTRDGRPFSYLYFRPLFLITEGEAAGLTVGYRWGLHYLFDSFTDDQGREVAGYSAALTSKHVQELHRFLTAVGVFDDGPLPFKANLLPVIWRRARQANKLVRIAVVDGFIDYIMSD